MYLKEPAGNGKFIITPLTGENIFSICPVCGEESPVDIVGLALEPDFEWTMQVCCPSCTARAEKIGLAAVLDEQKKSLLHNLKGKQERK